MDNQINKLQVECLKRRITNYVQTKFEELKEVEVGDARVQLMDAQNRQSELYREWNKVSYTKWEKFLISIKLKDVEPISEAERELDDLNTIIRRCKHDIYMYSQPNITVMSEIVNHIDNIILDGYGQPLSTQLKRFEGMVDVAIAKYKVENKLT